MIHFFKGTAEKQSLEQFLCVDSSSSYPSVKTIRREPKWKHGIRDIVGEWHVTEVRVQGGKTSKCSG